MLALWRLMQVLQAGRGLGWIGVERGGVQRIEVDWGELGWIGVDWGELRLIGVD